jgi:hypothetical protein
MSDAEPSKPTSDSIRGFAERHKVSVPYVYAVAKKQRDYDAAVARGEKPKGARPLAPRIVKVGRHSRILDKDEREYLDALCGLGGAP